MLVANCTRAQGSLGCVPSSPRGTAGLRREPQAPPLGTFFTAQDMSLSRGRFAGVSAAGVSRGDVKADVEAHRGS